MARMRSAGSAVEVEDPHDTIKVRGRHEPRTARAGSHDPDRGTMRELALERLVGTEDHELAVVGLLPAMVAGRRLSRAAVSAVVGW